MDGYYRAGSITDHKVKADEAVAEAARQDQGVDKVLVWRRKAGEYHSETPMVDGRDFFVDEVIGKYAGQEVAPVSQPAGAPPIPYVHQRHHRAAEGRAALDRRLYVLRGRHVEVLPGHPPG